MRSGNGLCLGYDVDGMLGKDMSECELFPKDKEDEDDQQEEEEEKKGWGKGGGGMKVERLGITEENDEVRLLGRAKYVCRRTRAVFIRGGGGKTRWRCCRR